MTVTRLLGLISVLAALLVAGCDPGVSTPTPGPSPTPFVYGIKDDIAYIDLMVPHHRLAIDMARIADERAQHGEVKGLARDIIVDQQDEINRMNLWRAEISAATPAAGEASPPATDHMHLPGMGADLNMLMSTSDFDREFIAAMLPHHQSAIAMSREAIPHLKHQYLRDLANDIIHVQQMEIDRMTQWQADWFR
jgi:uncharacterized protein (DUF305 family)